MRKSLYLPSVIFLLLAGCVPALGSKCLKQPSVSKAYDEAAAVFLGKVVEVDDFYIKFKVERTWKEAASDEVVLVLGAVELENGIIFNRDLLRRYNFYLGKEYLVYAEKIPKGLYAYRCSRTKPKEDARKDIEELERLHKQKA